MSQEPQKDQKFRRKALLGFAEYVWNPKETRWRLRPRWGILLITLGSLAVIGYLSLAGVYYALNRWHRGVHDTTYGHMLVYVFPEPLPVLGVSWAPGPIKRTVESVRKQQGKKLSAELFARGKAAMEKGDLRNASFLILQASRLDPQNTEARLLSSQVMLAYRRDDDAIEIMEEALAVITDKPEFALEYIRMCFAKEQEYRVIAMAKYVLAHEATSPAVRDLFAKALASAQFQRGDFAGTRATIEKYNLSRTPEGFMLNVRMLWETGKNDEAIAMLEPVAMASTKDPSFLTALIELKRKNDDLNGARAAASLYLLRANDRYQAHIKLFELLESPEETPRRIEAIERYIKSFSNNEAAMLLLSEYASDRGDTELCRRVMLIANEQKFADAPRFELLYIEAHLKAERYQETVAFVDKLFMDNPPWLPKYRQVFDCLRMVAQMSMNRHDMSEIGFNRLKDRAEVLPLAFMTTVAKKLVQIGRTEDAMRVIDLAYYRNGKSHTALNNVVDVHLLAGGSPDTPKLLAQLLRNRRPNKDILKMARDVIAGDAYLFEPDREKLLLQIERMERGESTLPEVDVFTPKEIEE